jgi:hypothetical protein
LALFPLLLSFEEWLQDPMVSDHRYDGVLVGLLTK